MRPKTHLNHDQAEFFSRAMDAFSSVKGTENSDDFFAPINQQLEGKEVLVATHKTASRFLDKYIKECPIPSLHRLLMSFVNHLEELCFDASGSHCVEGLIVQAVSYIDIKDFKPTFLELFKNLFSSIRSIGVTEMCEDKYASHVIRCVIFKLGPAKELNALVDKMCRQIIQALLQKPDRTRMTQFSAVLQTITKVDRDNYPKLLTYLISSVPTNFDDICDRSSSHLVEEILKLGFEKTIQAVYDNIFKTHCIRAARHSTANFVMQRWLEVCGKDLLGEVAKELLTDFSGILNDMPEVILALCNASARLEYFQENIVAELNKFRNGRNIIDLLLGIRKEKTGAQILQALCRFQKKPSDIIVGAFLDLTSERMREVCVSKTGTFVVTEFLRSKLSKSAKYKLIRHLIPILPSIASDRAGSYIVEDAFKAGDISLKVNICEALANNEIKSSAPNVWRSLKIDTFISRRGLWEHEMSAIEHVENAMKDIIEDEQVAPANEEKIIVHKRRHHHEE